MHNFIKSVANAFHQTVQKVMPSAKIAGFHVVSSDLEKVTIMAHLIITNPGPLPLAFTNASYSIMINGKEIFSGSIPGGITVGAHYASTVNIPVKIIYRDIMACLKPGNVNSYRVNACVSLVLPVIGSHRLPVEITGDFSLPNIPEVKIKDIQIGNASNEEISASVQLNVANKDEIELELNNLEVDVKLSNVRIASVKVSKVLLRKKSSICMVIPVSLRPKDMTNALLDWIQGKNFCSSVMGNVDVNTPWGPLKLRF
ncbi:uncharacterized protein LOC109830811 [Asparagus officinalis]|uniref:uncharacterized protein LOC109830811 n=1 Tax=Asparagus officinalis TaxID=4686 RepID=UPI00098E5A35|nr:uncharacterized protein LOC109830811 [Asparagus officinalis]